MEKQSLLVDLLENRASNSVAIIDKLGRHTYTEINSLALKIGGWLYDFGVKPKDRVVICGENSSRLVAAIFGVLKINGIFVPIHPDTPQSVFDFVVQDCTPAALIMDGSIAKKIVGLLSHINKPVLLLSDDNVINDNFSFLLSSWSNVSQYFEYPRSNRFLSTSLAAIVYTSGSSKDPRGVMLPHRQMTFATTSINRVIGNSSKDVILCGLPLSFDYGLYQIFLTFQVGAKLVLESGFHIPMAIPQLINYHSITGFPGVPSIFGLLLRSRLLERVNLPSLRYITSTGDVFPTTYIEKLQRLLPNTEIFPMYGLTECKRVSIVPRNQLAGHGSSVGLPLPGTKVRVVDKNGLPVRQGEVGELVVSGPHIMAGYWNNPKETAEKFQYDESNGEPILYTGDNFYIDEDGYLYFVGRIEKFIKSRGHKVSPLKIESIIYKINGVIEAAVVGVPHPILGEAICLFISFSTKKNATVKTIYEYCKQNLPSVSCPTFIEIMTALPKTLNGKIDKNHLRQLALEKVGVG